MLRSALHGADPAHPGRVRGGPGEAGEVRARARPRGASDRARRRAGRRARRGREARRRRPGGREARPAGGAGLTTRDEVALVEAHAASGADHARAYLRLAQLEAVAGAAFLGAGPELLGREAA